MSTKVYNLLSENNISSININALKRSYNILMKKQLINENNLLSEEEINIILNYKDPSELNSLYNLSINGYSSFREMVLDF